MAGNYFYDPRPFYDLNHHNLVSMDELFYGRREPPPWYMHQMPHYMPHHMPHARYDEQPRSRSVEPQRPEQYIRREDQFREYRRPDVRDDIYTDYGYNMYGANRGQQPPPQKNQNQGGNNSNNNNSNNNNNNGNGNKGKTQQKNRQDDSDDSDSEKKHKGGNSNNKSINNHSGGNNGPNSWSDNKGFRKHGHHRRSLSLTQTVLKKLGLRDDSSSSDSDGDRRGSRTNSKRGGHGNGHVQQLKADTKPYTVRFDDQFYGPSHGHSHQSNNNNNNNNNSNNSNKKGEKLGEDHGSHGKNKGGGQPQGILKTSKNKHGDDGYSSDDENRGHKNHGNGKGGGADSGKKNAQAVTKQLGRSQSMDFRVNLCCENCERKVKRALRKMDVDQVHTDQWNNRVVVVGGAKPESVLKKLRSVKKDTHVWHSHK